MSSLWTNQVKNNDACHLNHIQIKRYIPRVTSEHLMEKRSNPIDSSFLYATTEKGRIFLQKYEKAQLNQIE